MAKVHNQGIIMFSTVFQSFGMSAKFGEQFESCVHGMRPFLTEEWKPLCPAVDFGSNLQINIPVSHP